MKVTPICVLPLLTATATVLAVPIRRDETHESRLGQHILEASLSALRPLFILGVAIGSISYTTNWFHRFQTMKAQEEGNDGTWEATRSREQAEHQKNMEGLDIILDLVHGYAENITREKHGFDPLVIPGKLEADVGRTYAG